MQKKILSATLLAATLASGCASIVSDSTWPVAINSQPNEADFTITDERGVTVNSGKTPQTVLLRSGDGYFSSSNYTITVKKEGYEPKTTHLYSDLNGWYWGNIIFGGLIGMLIVDPITGAMWTLPESHVTSLDSKSAAQNSHAHELKIVNLDTIPESERSKLVRIN